MFMVPLASDVVQEGNAPGSNIVIICPSPASPPATAKKILSKGSVDVKTSFRLPGCYWRVCQRRKENL